MTIEKPEIRADGQLVTDWESVYVRRSFTEVAGAFRITGPGFLVHDGGRYSNFPKAGQLRPGAKVSIRTEDGKPLITDARVEDFSLEVTPSGQRVTIVGRDIGGDLVDSSVRIPPNEWAGLKPFTVVQTILQGQFDVPIKVGPGGANEGERIPSFAVNPGERLAEAFDRALGPTGLLHYVDEFGLLVVEKAASRRTSTVIRDGPKGIVRRQRWQESYSTRYARYEVLGQFSSAGQVPANVSASPRGTAIDPGIRDIAPGRSLTVVMGRQGQQQDVERAAIKLAQTRRGQGSILSLELVGWRGSEGAQLWGVNSIVPVALTELMNAPGSSPVDGEGATAPPTEVTPVDLLIRSVAFSLSSRGTTSTLDLVPAEAYGIDKQGTTPGVEFGDF